MQLHELVDVSNAVSSTRGRLDKIGRLAQLLQRLRPDEIAIAVAYLSGSLPQGRIGIGWSVVSSGRAAAPAAAEPSLELGDIHDVFDRIANVSGPGATRMRARFLTDLFSRATESEQEFSCGCCRASSARARRKACLPKPSPRLRRRPPKPFARRR